MKQIRNNQLDGLGIMEKDWHYIPDCHCEKYEKEIEALKQQNKELMDFVGEISQGTYDADTKGQMVAQELIDKHGGE